MTLNLRDHFDRAVSDDPGAELGAVAHAAIAAGGRLRRRRRQRIAAGVAAGVVVVAGAVAGLNARSAEPPITVAAAMRPVTAPSCLQQPVEANATDAVIFLAAGVTGAQRSALGEALDDDPRAGTVIFENRQQAYERFRARFMENPDLLEAVGPQQLPESFRLRLTAAEEYTALRQRYAAMAA